MPLPTTLTALVTAGYTVELTFGDGPFATYRVTGAGLETYLRTDDDAAIASIAATTAAEREVERDAPPK